MLVLAMLLLACGLGATLLYGVMPFVARSAAEALEANVVWGAVAGLGIVLGGTLLWQGVNAVRGRASRRAARAFPPLIVFVGVFALALALGVGARAIESAQAFLFPPWHILAASIPPLAFLAYAARRLGVATSMRALVAAFSWGALGGTFFAFLFELVVALAFVIVLVIVLAFTPAGLAFIEEWEQRLAFGIQPDDPTLLSSLFANPIIVTAMLVYFALVIPVIEEAFKALIVAFADARRTCLAEATLWGIGAGAGFALIENVFNGGAMIAFWLPTIVLRVGATVIHVANGATMGRGWYAARVEGRWERLFGAYGVCVLVHALWNAAAIGIGGNAFVWLGDAGRSGGAWSAGVMTLALLVLLGALMLWALMRIVAAVRSARQALPEKM